MTRNLPLALPWIALVATLATITLDNLRERTHMRIAGPDRLSHSDRQSVPNPKQLDGDGTALDPVCHMTVRIASAHKVTVDSRIHGFCSSYCRDRFVRSPDIRSQPTTPPNTHTMRGIPTWMYQGAVALLILLSFVLFERRPDSGTPRRESPRFDLLRSPTLRAIVKWRYLRPLVRSVFVLAFFTIIAAGLFGDQNPAHNIAPLLTWTLWWVGLVFLVLYLGKAWCYVCPWDAVATWIERMGWTTPRRDGLGLGLKWPRALRNIWLAVFFFLGLTWIELGMGITQIPRATAYVALGMLAMSIVSALIFERKAFCRYACLVGRVSGLYAMFSSVELRTADPDACDSCKTMDCYRGNNQGDGCPTHEFPKTMDVSTYCILCTECIRTCPTDNITLKLRPWGEDLVTSDRARTDEAFLALVLLSMTAFHGLTMTPVWFEMVGATEASLGIARSLAFALLMGAVLVVPLLLYGMICHLAAHLSGTLPTRTFFLEYAYAMLPIALFYHLAHNAEHFLMEGPRIFALLSDPFGWGWDLFGTARRTFPPLISLEGLWGLQVVFVIVGHVYSLWVSSHITRRLLPRRRVAIRSQVPMLVAAVAFSVVSLWLLNQPMEMRISGM